MSKKLKKQIQEWRDHGFNTGTIREALGLPPIAVVDTTTDSTMFKNKREFIQVDISSNACMNKDTSTPPPLNEKKRSWWNTQAVWVNNSDMIYTIVMAIILTLLVTYCFGGIRMKDDKKDTSVYYKVKVQDVQTGVYSYFNNIDSSMHPGEMYYVSPDGHLLGGTLSPFTYKVMIMCRYPADWIEPKPEQDKSRQIDTSHIIIDSVITF